MPSPLNLRRPSSDCTPGQPTPVFPEERLPIGFATFLRDPIVDLDQRQKLVSDFLVAGKAKLCHIRENLAKPKEANFSAFYFEEV